MDREPEGLTQVPRVHQERPAPARDAACARRQTEKRVWRESRGWKPAQVNVSSHVSPAPRSLLTRCLTCSRPTNRVMLLTHQHRRFWALRSAGGASHSIKLRLMTHAHLPILPPGSPLRTSSFLHAKRSWETDSIMHSTLRKELSLFLKASLFFNSFKTNSFKQIRCKTPAF